MIKYILALSLLAGCGLTILNPFDRNCDDPERPGFPQIGGCLEDAPQGAAGGPCFSGGAGYCNDDSLQCIGGTCYPCGYSSDPIEPCCGGQMASDPGTCLDGSQCALIPDGDGWYGCLGGTSSPPAPNCAPGEKPNYYVWTLTATCGEKEYSFCAPTDDDAQAYVDETLGSIPHGAPVTDPNSGQPTKTTMCGSGGADCTLGSQDESMGTTFFYFTSDQIPACEMALDPGCNTWTQADSMGNCPGMM